jgi:PTS system N-acetylgalactosamine-specific IIA component
LLGLIVCGHGKFASGLKSNLEMIAGDQDKVIFIDFVKGMTPNQLESFYEKAILKLGLKEGIIFLTDVPGGTPFNQAVKVKLNHENVGVLSGINVPLLLEGLLQRNMNVQRYLQFAINAGQRSMVSFDFDHIKTHNEAKKLSESDGI